MIISETVLKEKFLEGDTVAYDYLIDNAETDEQVEKLVKLQNMPEASFPANCAFTQGDKDHEEYMREQSRVLMSLGIDIDKLLG